MMTKKHYKAIAEILNKKFLEMDNSLCNGTQDVVPIQEEIVKELATFLKTDNPNFDKTKFERACGTII
jgi:hypothetical protein|tara:strand:+ start:695 stop:898 length:204 start_codon:yes stop_codon:yes gene_type:complete